MIHARTRTQVGAVALLSLFAAIVALAGLFVWAPFALVPWLVAICDPRAMRRAFKPVALWINAWRYKDAEEEVAHLVALRQSAIARERWLRAKQVRLAEERARIAGR